MLKTEVYMANADGRLIFLDLERDRYCGLGREASLIICRLGEVDQQHHTSAMENLRAAGLICVGGETGRSLRTTDYGAPKTSLGASTNRLDLPHLPKAIACRALATRRLRRWHIAKVVEARRAARSRWRNGAESALVERAAARFQAWRPVGARKGGCLSDSLSLLFFLGREGAEADWVFAVKAVPFEAHCWVQLGDVVLNDSIESTACYTPIMVV